MAVNNATPQSTDEEDIGCVKSISDTQTDQEQNESVGARVTIPTRVRGGGLAIRAYSPDDDESLMELERLSPRGEPRPFVHFRRQFVDRANLFANPHTIVAEKDNRPVGVTSIAIKDTHIGGFPVRVSYSFDTRVHPQYRRLGVANAMQEEKLAFLRSQGVHGIYALVVATNNASIKMLEKVGFHKVRMILYLTFTPYPLIIPPTDVPYSFDAPHHIEEIRDTFSQRDLFIANVANSVANFNFERVVMNDGQSNVVGLSTFDQSFVYQQVSADEPWPSEAEISKRARTLRIFDEIGIRNPHDLRMAFDHVRDLAVVSNVAKLTWLIDRSDPVPGFLFEESSTQKDYWLLFAPLVPDWEPSWQGSPVYIDPRDL
jgi:ribosomal protein S18 acetylase RimI-like enzyme